MYMVLSTAGSGKTLVLALRALRIARQILDVNPLANKRILCVCFNQSMADEMHRRISVLVNECKLSGDVAVTRSGQSVSRGVTIEVRTFHGLGRFILNAANPAERDRVGLPYGYLNVLHGRQLAKYYFDALKHGGILKAEATEKSSKQKVYHLMSFFEDFKGKKFDKICERYMMKTAALSSASSSASTSTTGSSNSWKKCKFTDGHAMKDFKHEYEIYEKLLYDRGVIDYGDMIIKSVRLLLLSDQLSDFVKQRYASVLVDEFQDVSASQLLMCQAAAEESQSITFVGDDDQQIYSWRTSNAWFCHQVVQHVFPMLKTLTLPENRRCQAHVVNAAYAVISHNVGRYPKRIEPVKEPTKSVQVVGCNSPDLEMKFVVASVDRLLHKTQYSGQRILVLFRVNDLLLQFQNAFQDAGIHTTRELQPNKQKIPVIGSVSLSTLALVTLIAPDVDVDTFVWAVTTLVTGLQQQVIHAILAKREREDGIQGSKHQASASSTNTPGRRKKQPFSSSSRRNSTSSSASSGKFTSVYLDRLKRYISSKQAKQYSMSSWKTNHDCDDDEIMVGLFDIVKLCDDMQVEIRKCCSVHQIVQYATEVVSESNEIGSQASVEENPYNQDNKSKSEQKRGFGGYDVLTTAARRVDAKSRQRERRDRERNPRKRVRIEKVSDLLKKRRLKSATTATKAATSYGDDDNDNDDDDDSNFNPDVEDDDDLEDFAELFSSDLKETKKQKRKALGIKDGNRDIDEDDFLLHRYVTFLGDDLTEFCNIVRRSLGDYTTGKLNDRRKSGGGNSDFGRSNVDAQTCPVFSTIHMAKGSTFDHVFVCGVNKYNFPNGQMVSGIGHMSSDANMEIDPTGMECQEERRVFFVAATRAVKTFVCTYASENPARNQPREYESMFIKEMRANMDKNNKHSSKSAAAASSNNSDTKCNNTVEETVVLTDHDIDRAVAQVLSN